TNAPTWFSELNQDPRYRVAAGLGAKVVQDQEQALLAGAWAQVDGIERANESLRHAQLSQNISLNTYSKNFMLNRAEDLLHVTAPFHARVKGSPVTIKR